VSSLPPAERERLLAVCETVEVGLREEVCAPNKPIDHVYFPLRAVFSHVAVIDEDVVEVGTIGSEGVVGLPAFLGSAWSPNLVFCQVPGSALRLTTESLFESLRGDGSLHDRLHRYTQALIIQIAQNVACNRIHTTEERAARWLLMTQDRVGADEFPMTQQFLAQMLGVRRPTVSVTAGVLQTAGLIRYTRGTITVTDRQRLAEAACDCYRVVRDEFDRLLDPRSLRPDR
jgi:CRP-like cAMP-binding protein